MRRLDRAFDRLASRGRRSDPDDVIDRLERRLDGEPAVVWISGRPEMKKTGTKVTRRRALGIAATAVGAALVVALPLGMLWRGDDPAATNQETTTLAAITTTVATTTALPEIVAAPTPAVVGDWTGSRLLVAVSAREMWIVRGGDDPDAEIGRFRDGAWTFWILEGDGWVRDLAAAPGGIVWAATDAGVFSFDGVEWTRSFDGAARHVAVVEDGSAWIDGAHPLWPARWDGESWVRLDRSTFMFLPNFPGAAFDGAMAASPNGQVWIAVYDSFRHRDALLRCGVAACDVVQIGNYPERIQVTVTMVEAAPSGDIWVAYFAHDVISGEGAASLDEVLARFDGEAWTTYPLPASGMGRLHFAVGPDGVVWCAGPDGLAYLDGTRWATLIGGQIIHAVEVAPDGTVLYIDDEGVHALSSP